MSADKTNDTNQKGQNEEANKKGGFQDNTDPNSLVPPTQTDPESKYFTNSNGTSIQSEQNLSRGGNNNREGVNRAYGDGGDRPRSNPSDNQSDRGK
ncbi:MULTISPECIES: hypothetical protein [Rufibacter]|uniref:Uncharacterized protein n=1 Tax=Rufibacter quisquiliarum TaxID=1549639 RepID=A0A839GI71_9BACT|nr:MULTISPECIES: hypothetical protein [Rufibacter]MBA9079344.1 hypothetical protein [Rufibacter quisquiliarum]